jgi:hypothetical protein
MFHLFLLRSSDFDLRYSFPNAIRLGVPAYSYLGNVSGIHENTGACLEWWPVGSAALPGAHFRVWPPFLLPRPGPLEAKPPPPPGSSRTPFSTVARGLGSARHWAGDFGALCAGGRWPWRARAGEGKVPPALLRREIHGL